MIKTCSDERMTYMKKLVMLVTVVLTVAMAAVVLLPETVMI